MQQWCNQRVEQLCASKMPPRSDKHFCFAEITTTNLITQTKTNVLHAHCTHALVTPAILAPALRPELCTMQANYCMSADSTTTF